MQGSARPLAWLVSALFTVNVGCGQIQLPVTFALQGENTITLEVPFFPPGNNVFSSSLLGGADATVSIDLNPFELFSPQGLVALIAIDQIRMAGTPIDLFGLNTGTICIYDDVENPGGGIAYLRPLRREGDFTLAFNTLISVTDPVLLGLFPDPLPFAAEVDTTVPITLSDLFGLIAGSGSGGIELSQELTSTLPDMPILGGSIVTADLTLATVEEFPSDPLLDECEAFIAGL
ncbi:MAG: hypothetical protein DCC71_01195 [Proteobacteria bacterium]|nr:MAG: hypothetical protein DCC71_01195 [Pseudomonadota bacterium]